MDANDLPKDVKDALDSALLKLSIWAHEITKKSIVVFEIKHVSDCLAGQSGTSIAGQSAGAPVIRKNKVDKEAVAKVIDNLVQDMMRKAKEGGQKEEGK